MSAAPWFDRLLAGHARVIVVVAHPDDEVLGCSGLLQHLPAVTIVHVTTGAPRHASDAARHGFATAEAYAAERADEAERALALAGIGVGQLLRLGFQDQDVSLHLSAVARTLQPLIASAQFVLTHAYEGGHSDHDAVAFAVHAARERLGPGDDPSLVEMPFYHAQEDGWVRQCFLPGGPAEVCLQLTPAERDRKTRMLAAHRTQGETLASFATDVERFRLAPRHDFGRLPHAGDLLYERHGWNLTRHSWSERVAAARSDLGLCPCP